MSYYIGIALFLSVLVYGTGVWKYKIAPYEQIQYLKYKLFNNDAYYTEKVERFKMNNPKTFCVMLGDSITEEGNWNELLGRDDIINRGISGDTTSGVLHRMELLGNHPKFCFVMIGINDFSRGASVEEVYGNCVKIIDTLEEKKITPMVQSVLLTDRPYLNPKVDALNRKLKALAESKKLCFIDLNPHLSSGGILDEKFTLDGLHLNARGYQIWADILKGYVH